MQQYGISWLAKEYNCLQLAYPRKDTTIHMFTRQCVDGSENEGTLNEEIEPKIMQPRVPEIIKCIKAWMIENMAQTCLFLDTTTFVQ